MAEATRVDYVEYSPGVKDVAMLGDLRVDLANVEIHCLSEGITHRGILGEFEDRRLDLGNYWGEYAKNNKMLVMIAIGVRDRLLKISHRDLEDFTEASTSSSGVGTVFHSRRSSMHRIEPLGTRMAIKILWICD